MDDTALANYQLGLVTGNIEAGRLDRACADLLGVPAGTEIWFSDYTLMKLRQRHGEINFSHYRNMPSILLHGFLAKGREGNLLDLWWAKLEHGKFAAFFVVLKATRKKEVFVETFHQIDRKEARRLLKRAKIESRLVREQPGATELLRRGTHLKREKKA